MEEKETVVTPEGEPTAPTDEQIEQQAEEEIKAESTPESPKPGEAEYSRAVQKRINDLTRQKHDALREAARAKSEMETWKRKAEAGERPLPPDPSTFMGVDGEMDRRKYQEAMVKYEDTLHGWRKAQDPAPHQEIPPETPSSARAEFLERAAPLIQKHADFYQVVNSEVFTPEMRDAMFDSDHGPEIAYYLGKNTAEAMRIGDLPPAQMFREIGRLEARFSATERRSVSAAPEPITPVRGTAGTKRDIDDVDDINEYMSRYKANLAERRKKDPFAGA